MLCLSNVEIDGKAIRQPGKIVRRIRKELDLTQKDLARIISKETGETVDAKYVARLENCGRQDAANPVSPTPAVANVLVKKIDSIGSIAMTNEPLVNKLANKLKASDFPTKTDIVINKSGNDESRERIYTYLKEFFAEDEKLIDKWLNSPNLELNNNPPMKYIKEGKAWVVLDLALAIGSGTPT